MEKDKTTELDPDNLPPVQAGWKYEIKQDEPKLGPHSNPILTLHQLDPSYQIQKQKAKMPERKEVKGYLIALTFDPVSFFSYEMYAFVESHLQLEIEDLSIFRDEEDKPSGIVVVQFFEEISTEKVKSIHGAPFKGSPVYVRLFSTQLSFLKYVTVQAEKELSRLSLPLRSSVPIVCIQGFKGDIDRVFEFFGRCGKITLVREKKYYSGSYFLVYFATEAAAKLCCRTFMGFRCPAGNLLVTPFYPLCSERCFSVSFCSDLDWLKEQLENFGNIEKIKKTEDGTYYVMMDTDTAKQACILLNGMICENARVSTAFIEYEQFSKIM